MFYKIVVCTDNNYGISKQGRIPWACPADKAWFKKITSTTTTPKKQNAVIMGNKTYTSLNIPCLANRINIVLSRQKQNDKPNVIFLYSVGEIEDFIAKSDIEDVYVIGGQQIYDLFKDKCLYIFHTLLNSSFMCDLFFSQDIFNGHEIIMSRQLSCDAVLYIYARSFMKTEEMLYQALINRVFENGIQTLERTGVGTIALFGETIRFDLHKFPLLTTKQVFFRGVFEELMWFLRGQTDNKILQDKDVHIWDHNAYSNNDCGKIYGYQWRNFNSQGIDQLCSLVKNITENNISEFRRLIISAWNPAQLKEMCLPPCHILSQWNVRGEYLDTLVFMRSCDIALGLPFNIASYALFNYFIAKITHKKPGYLVFMIGNAHVYLNHVSALKTQLERAPYAFPDLVILKDINSVDDMLSLEYTDIHIKGYRAYASIKMEIN